MLTLIMYMHFRKINFMAAIDYDSTKIFLQRKFPDLQTQVLPMRFRSVCE